jgi:hypothetical protein
MILLFTLIAHFLVTIARFARPGVLAQLRQNRWRSDTLRLSWSARGGVRRI